MQICSYTIKEGINIVVIKSVFTMGLLRATYVTTAHQWVFFLLLLLNIQELQTNRIYT